MEASRSMIFSRTLSQPVMRPATRPPAWRQRGQPGVGARGNQRGADGAAQRKAAVHRQVGKAQQRNEISTPSATRRRSGRFQWRRAARKETWGKGAENKRSHDVAPGVRMAVFPPSKPLT
jgi:hypothetical protein